MTGNLLILMNSSYEKGSDDSGSLTVDLAVVRKVWLIILSTLYGPSLICYLVILFWMSKIRDLWTRLTNHIIIANFLVNLIQVRMRNRVYRIMSIAKFYWNIFHFRLHVNYLLHWLFSQTDTYHFRTFIFANFGFPLNLV